MAAVFIRLLNMSIAAGFLILTVIFLRLLLRRAPKWTRCLLWGLVAVRLVCPFSPESSLSLIPSAEFIDPAIVGNGLNFQARNDGTDGIVKKDAPGSGAPAVDAALHSGAGTGEPASDVKSGAVPEPSDETGDLASDVKSGAVSGPSGEAGKPASDVKSGVMSGPSGETGNSAPVLSNSAEDGFSGDFYNVFSAAGYLWAAGLAGFLCYALFGFMRMKRRLREAVRLQDNIYICDAVRSPFILGLARPCIYLSSSLEKSGREYCVAHEKAHIGRLDHWWKLTGYVLLSVYWFSPLVWAAYILFCRDIELACDERVIKDMSLKGRRAYSEALLSCSLQRKALLVCPLAFGEVGVKERIKNVLCYRKPVFWAAAAAVAVCVVTAVCFLTNPKPSDQSLTDYKKLASAAYQTESIGVTYPAEGSLAALAKVEGRFVGELLDGAQWDRKRESSPTNQAADIVIIFNESQEIRFYESEPELAVVACNGLQQYYEMKNMSYQDVFERVSAAALESAAASVEAAENAGDADGLLQMPAFGAAAEEAVRSAIMDHNQSRFTSPCDVACCDFVLLEAMAGIPVRGSETHRVTYYGWALYQTYRVLEEGLENVGGCHVPVALTFDVSGEKYALREYWEPRDGSDKTAEVRERFPEHVAENGVDGGKYILEQTRRCYGEAVEQSGLDTDSVVSGLLEKLCEPGPWSDLRSYIDQHGREYRELIYYGDYTLQYCLQELAGGDETGLRGRIMTALCEDILQGRGTIPSDAELLGEGARDQGPTSSDAEPSGEGARDQGPTSAGAEPSGGGAGGGGRSESDPEQGIEDAPIVEKAREAKERAIAEKLALLAYSPETCDGLPEVSVKGGDGAEYQINLSEGWVWKDKTQQAELTEELILEIQRWLTMK